MFNEEIIVGLDIGTTKICVLVGKKDPLGTLELLGVGTAASDGVVRGVITNIDKTVIAMRAAIEAAEEASGININVVNVGISGSHIQRTRHQGSITREATEHEITVEDVHRLAGDMYRTVTPPGSTIIHVMPQTYTVDYEANIKDPVGMSGVKLAGDFQIITAQENALKNIYKCLERAHLKVDKLLVTSLADSLAVLSNEEKEAGICLVDIGGGTVDLAVFQEGLLRHAAVLPLGGNNITADIKHGSQVMEQQAERLKIKFGKAMAEATSENELVTIPGLRDRPPKEVAVRNLAHIIEARMEEIIEWVDQEIKASDFAAQLAGGIVITGEGATLKEVQALFEAITGLDTRIGYPNEHLGEAEASNMKQPMYTTATGLALAGFKAIDERNEYYKTTKSAHKDMKNTNTQKAQQKTKGDFFSRMLHKTKGLLMDDYDEKTGY